MQNQGFGRPPSGKSGFRSIYAITLLVAVAIAVSPLLIRGPACGIDFVFHFVSWQDALISWRHGVLYPRWATSPNFNAGEPRFMFYPPLIWMLGAALGSFLPWTVVPAALNALLLAGAGFATRALARQHLAEAPATLAGCLAIFSGYDLYEMFHHGDFALMSGGFWIPLLLFFWLRIAAIGSPAFYRVRDKNLLWLALALAGTWLSNTPLGLMATYMLLALGLFDAVRSRSWAPIVSAAFAVILAVGLAGFYLVPAASEQHWIDIARLFAAPEHLIQNRWITSELTNPPHRAFPSQRIRGVIEVCMLLMALGGLAFQWRRGLWPSRNRTEARRWSSALAFLSLAVLFLMLPISLPVWNIVPRLRYLQYPWRWLVVLEAPMAILFAHGIWPAHPRWRPCIAGLCALLFLSVTYAAATRDHIFLPCPRSNSSPDSIAGINRALAPRGIGVGGYDEYTSPPGARNDLIATGLPSACLVRDPLTSLSNVPATGVVALYTPRAWSPALGTCDQSFFTPEQPEHFDLHAQTEHAGYLVLRLRSYPAWKIAVNGAKPVALPKRADGLIAVPVPAGAVHLTVDWVNTRDVLVGRLLSIASVLFAILISLFFKHSPAGLAGTRRNPARQGPANPSAPEAAP